MIHKTRIIILATLLLTQMCFGQFFVGGAFTNNVSSYPVKGYPKIFYSAFHPGMDFFLEKKLNKKERNQLWAELDLGGFYHRLIQTAVKVNTNFHYRFSINSRLFTDVGLGGGYLHSFAQYTMFRLNENGEYEKISGFRGRPQFLALVCLGGGICLNKNDRDKIQLLLQFRTFAQGLFARGYAPAIVYNAFFVGARFRLQNK